MVDWLIRPMLLSDVDSVVAVHQDAFQNFFLTFLGPAFLKELYSAIVTDPSGIAYVCEKATRVQGFVAGTDLPSGLYRCLLHQRWWRFAWASAVPALRHPFVIPRLLRAFSMPSRATQQERRGTLMSIAVLPDAQGQGVGSALVQAFLAEAGQRGLHQVDLTTDQDDNETVNAFYQNMGFVCVRTFTTPEGRSMNEYVIVLKKEQDDA